METHDFLKTHRHAPLCALENMPCRVAYGADELKRILPHREPFLLVDSVEGMNLQEETLIGSRFVSASDPVFRGHFPDYPVYPGMLLLEMMGQMATALAYFLAHGGHQILPETGPLHVRATKVLGAEFIEPVRPNSRVTILGKRVYWDGFCGRFAGQALVDHKICCTGVAELYFP